MLKLQYFGHLKLRADSLEKILMLGKIEGRRRRGQQEDEMAGWHHQRDGHVFEQTWEIVKDRKVWCAVIHGVAKSWTWLSDWIATTTSTKPLHPRITVNDEIQVKHGSCVCLVMSNSVTPWGVAYQAPLCTEFFRQEYCDGLPFPIPRHFPEPGIGAVSSALAGRFFFLPLPNLGSPKIWVSLQ